MQPYVLMTDSNSEIPFSWEDEYDIKVLPMPYTINDEEFDYDLGRNTDFKAFYDQLRNGAKILTIQRNVEDFKAIWREFLDKGLDVLYVGFSSQLSGTYNNAVMAREEILKEYPERNVTVIDSLTISSPLGLLVRECAKKRLQGESLAQVAEWTEVNKFRVNGLFCVDDLTYLKRGGRISGSAALFGTMLSVKPILYISEEGKLFALEKAKGRKKGLKRMVEIMTAQVKSTPVDAASVIHADDESGAQYVQNLLRESGFSGEIIINNIGPVIGAHAGPGTVAVCYFADARIQGK